MNMQLSLPGTGVEPEAPPPVPITAKHVKREDHLVEYKRTPHTCHFYPPAYRCVCGKQGQQPAPVQRWVTFTAASAANGD